MGKKRKIRAYARSYGQKHAQHPIIKRLRQVEAAASEVQVDLTPPAPAAITTPTDPSRNRPVSRQSEPAQQASEAPKSAKAIRAAKAAKVVKPAKTETAKAAKVSQGAKTAASRVKSKKDSSAKEPPTRRRGSTASKTDN